MAVHRRQDYNYHLPEAAIADRPATARVQSRLLVMEAGSRHFQHKRFSDLGDYLRPHDLLVFNNTKVIPARLAAIKTDTGGRGELLVERLLEGNRLLCQINFSRPPTQGTRLRLTAPAGPLSDDDTVEALVLDRQQSLFQIALLSEDDPLAILHRLGSVPLPPYIKRPADAGDARYQTVYASRHGAVAAPTAGLHFDWPLLNRLAEAGIARTELTLHIGAGTFQPVRYEDIHRHEMHRECYEVPGEAMQAVNHCRTKGGRVIAVGTTSVRALEAAAAEGTLAPWSGETALFIYPPYEFRVVDAIITNFHMPESTLLMLIAAFAGLAPVQAAYAEALAEGYRFLSYGDAMLILPAKAAYA